MNSHLSKTLYFILPMLASFGVQAESAPIPLRAAPQSETSQYPVATEAYNPAPAQQGQHKAPGLGVAESYNFPATRQELEQAATQCKSEVEQLYAMRSQIPRYRMPYFQKQVGEAQMRCKKLQELAITIKKADEQLYTYKQSLQHAQSTIE